MVARLKEVEKYRVDLVNIVLDSDEIRRLDEGSVHVLDLLSQTGRHDEERRIVVNHISVALFADMLHFIYEGLRALEKRKLTVALCLLRKPLREGTLISARMCADEEAFMEEFTQNIAGLNNSDDRLDILEAALTRCRAKLFGTSEQIFNTIYKKTLNDGLAIYFDLATHYVTTYRHTKTENYNINFIFKNPHDTDIYENIYEHLAKGLLFLNMMQMELYRRMSSEMIPGHFNWLVLTSLAVYQAIFIPGPCGFGRMFNEIFSECISCKRCGNSVRILKADVPRLCLLDEWVCKTCKTSNKIPLTQILYTLETDAFDSLHV